MIQIINSKEEFRKFLESDIRILLELEVGVFFVDSKNTPYLMRISPHSDFFWFFCDPIFMGKRHGSKIRDEDMIVWAKETDNNDLDHIKYPIRISFEKNFIMEEKLYREEI